VTKANDSLRIVAGRFATDLTRMLNQTVCDDASVGFVERPDDASASFGTGLWRGHAPSYTPLRSASSCRVWLRIVGQLFLDPRGYLTVRRSVYAWAAGDKQHELLHYDYERDNPVFPDAHIQVNGGGPGWDELLPACGKTPDSLGKLHLPVGGRRYRPALEDLLEALVMEKILDPKPGWNRVLEAERAEFRRRQLKAAVRNDPDTAIAALHDAGYEVIPPDRAPNVVEIAERRRGRHWGRGRKR
jgi:hypothetical protein